MDSKTTDTKEMDTSEMDLSRERRKRGTIRFLVFGSLLFGLVFIFFYLACFGFEYEHRFRDGYAGPSSASQATGIGVLMGSFLLSFLLGMNIDGETKWLKKTIRSIKYTILVALLGFVISLPVLFPGYMAVIYE